MLFVEILRTVFYPQTIEVWSLNTYLCSFSERAVDPTLISDVPLKWKPSHSKPQNGKLHPASTPAPSFTIHCTAHRKFRGLPSWSVLYPGTHFSQRHWHLANGRQPIVTVSGAYVPPKTRRTDPFLRTFTLRHSNTQQNICARPSTVNRFSHLNQNNYWSDRLSFLLEDIGRISRSMTNWNSIKPEQRFMLRPLVPVIISSLILLESLLVIFRLIFAEV